MKLPQRYKAFSLLELLIVMSIFMVISFMGVSSFSGLRDTISLNEDVLNLELDVRFVQRSALLLDRGADERWPFGLGIDFSDLEYNGKYTVFKWCSPYGEFGDTRTRGTLPNYDDVLDVGLTNANMPFSITETECEYNDLRSVLALVPAIPAVQITENFVITIPESSDVAGDTAQKPEYILFESVSGRMFMYDSSGRLVNYAGNGEIVANPTDMIIEIVSPVTDVKKTITIQKISGKLSVESSDVAEI